MRSRLKIYKQGDCDALCGLYSIINALTTLCPELNTTHVEALFEALIANLARHQKRPLSVVYSGMNSRRLRTLLNFGIAYINKRFSAQIERMPLGLPRRHKTIRQLCEHLRQALEGDRVAIFLIDGIYYHWTVAHEITDKTIKLHDSSGMKYLRRSSCTLRLTQNGHRLFRNQIILLRRDK